MKNESVDQRVRITKLLIREAFLKLLETKPVQRITVSELCDEAGINRGTFYTHYEDIFHLFEQIEIDALEEFEQSLSSILKDISSLKNTAAICITLFNVIKNNSMLCKIMLGGSGNRKLINKFLELGKRFYMSAYLRYYPNIDRSKLEDFYLFISSGCVALLENWILSDKSQPIEAVAKIAAELIENGAHYLL